MILNCIPSILSKSFTVTGKHTLSPWLAVSSARISVKPSIGGLTVTVPLFTVLVTGSPSPFWIVRGAGIVTSEVVFPVTLKHNLTSEALLARVTPVALLQFTVNTPGEGFVIDAAPQPGKVALKFCAPVKLRIEAL